MHLWKFVIFTHFLVSMHILQPAFVVIPDLKSIWVISYRVNTVNYVMHCLIFKGHCVELESCPCVIIGYQMEL